MAAPSRAQPKPEPASPKVPLLRQGDHLTAAEFERRYHRMPECKKAELIEGRVYMPSPVCHDEHGAPHFKFVTWLGVYSAFTPGTDGGDNSTLRLDLNNRPQPDAFLRLLTQFGGQSLIDSDGYVVRAPELISEIAASSVSYDLHDKLEAYLRNGVREYVVWRVLDVEVDWFVLRENRYERLALSPSGYYQSEVFPGLWLDPAALLRSDLAAVLKVVQQGVASAEHAAFVKQLQENASAK